MWNNEAYQQVRSPLTPVLTGALVQGTCFRTQIPIACACGCVFFYLRLSNNAPLLLLLLFRFCLCAVCNNGQPSEQILEERTKELTKKQRHLSTGETRQFDYRPVGEKNPLFARLGEKERRCCCLMYICRELLGFILSWVSPAIMLAGTRGALPRKRLQLNACESCFSFLAVRSCLFFSLFSVESRPRAAETGRLRLVRLDFAPLSLLR